MDNSQQVFRGVSFRNLINLQGSGTGFLLIRISFGSSKLLRRCSCVERVHLQFFFLFFMPFLPSFRVFWLWVLLVFPGLAITQLTFDSTCYNVVINEGTSSQMVIDGSVHIDNTFDIIVEMTKYAKNILVKAIWDPSIARGNRQRVLDLLVNLGLPQTHPNFHDMVNALIGTFFDIHESRNADLRDQLNILTTQSNLKTGMTPTILAGP